MQDIGAPEAWSLLHHAGKLSNKIKIAILDGSFAPNADFPESITYVSVVPGMSDPRNARKSWGDSWHGTNVFNTAMAKPDNNFGIAGTAGPVGKPLLIYTYEETLN